MNKSYSDFICKIYILTLKTIVINIINPIGRNLEVYD